MRTAPRSFALLSPAAFALLGALAWAPAQAAWSTSPYVNLPVTLTAGTSASSQSVLSDGVGGAFVAWVDGRNQATTGYDIYLAHILKSGVMDPAWPVNGLAVCAAAGDQSGPILVADNTGGAIVVWRDGRTVTSDIFGARVNSNGTLASGWTTPNGKQIGAATPSGIARDEYAQVACSDGVGGVIVAWDLIYTPNSDEDIYAVRILANGNVAAGWQANGSVIDAASGFQSNPCIAPDGAGGAIIAFVDNFLVPAPQLRYRTVSFSGVVTIPASDLVSAANGIGQLYPIGASDGLNGMFIAWSDQRISPAGVGIADITPAGPGGSPFYYANPIFGTATDISVPEQIVPDGVGGLYLSWWDASLSRPIHLTHVTGNATWAPGWNTSGVTIGQHTNAAIVPDGTSGVMAAYFDGYDIQGARYLSGGTPGTGWTSPDYVQRGLQLPGDSGRVLRRLERHDRGVAGRARFVPGPVRTLRAARRSLRRARRRERADGRRQGHAERSGRTRACELESELPRRRTGARHLELLRVSPAAAILRGSAGQGRALQARDR